MFYSVNMSDNLTILQAKAYQFIKVLRTHKTEKDGKVPGETLIILPYCTTLQNTNKK